MWLFKIYPAQNKLVILLLLQIKVDLTICVFNQMDQLLLVGSGDVHVPYNGVTFILGGSNGAKHGLIQIQPIY